MENQSTIKLGVSKYKNIMGVTCYMNSILHILQQTPMFIQYITQFKFKNVLLQKVELISSKNSDEDKEDIVKNFVIFELFRLFKVSLENDDNSITPTSFKTIIGKKNDMWDEMNHQDSQEFLNFLISQLEEEIGEKVTFIPGNFLSEVHSDEKLDFNAIIAMKAWETFQSKEYSPLKIMFNGMIESNRRCSYCNSNNYLFEPFVTLALSIPIKNKSDIKKEFSIYDCLDHMIQEEQLDSSNMVTCDMCGIKNQGYNKTLLWQTPKILVIHIKRFMTNSFGIPTQKLNNNIEYPIQNLDLLKYFNPHSPHKESSKYDLFGVNLHQAFGYGMNINKGHYTSFVKNMMNHNWYYYNDANDVECVPNSNSLQHMNAYMLFYYRHD
jgi:ubiquitin C-terminal hydrolase